MHARLPSVDDLSTAYLVVEVDDTSKGAPATFVRLIPWNLVAIVCGRRYGDGMVKVHSA